MITTNVSLSCNHKDCKTAPVTGAARKAVKVAARKNGWKVKGLKVIFCPAHRSEEGYPTAAQRKEARLAKKAKAAVAKKVTKAATNLVKPATKKVTKPAVTAKPIAKKAVKVVNTGIGQAVPGMVARSAKQASAKK